MAAKLIQSVMNERYVSNRISIVQSVELPFEEVDIPRIRFVHLVQQVVHVVSSLNLFIIDTTLYLETRLFLFCIDQ